MHPKLTVNFPNKGEFLHVRVSLLPHTGTHKVCRVGENAQGEACDPKIALGEAWNLQSLPGDQAVHAGMFMTGEVSGVGGSCLGEVQGVPPTEGHAGGLMLRGFQRVHAWRADTQGFNIRGVHAKGFQRVHTPRVKCPGWVGGFIPGRGSPIRSTPRLHQTTLPSMPHAEIYISPPPLPYLPIRRCARYHPTNQRSRCPPPRPSNRRPAWAWPAERRIMNNS